MPCKRFPFFCLLRFQAARQRLQSARETLSGPEGWGLWRTLHAHAAGQANFLVARIAAVYELGPRGHPLSVTSPHLFCAHYEALARPKLTASTLLTNAAAGNRQQMISQAAVVNDLIQLDGQSPMKIGAKNVNDLKRASITSGNRPPRPGHTGSTSFNLISLDSPKLTDQTSVKHDVDARSSVQSVGSSRRKQPPTTTPSSVLEAVLATQPLDQVMDVSWWAAGASPAARSEAGNDSLSVTPRSLSRGSSFNSDDSSIDLDDVIMRALHSRNSEGVAESSSTKPANPTSTASPSVPTSTRHVSSNVAGNASTPSSLTTPTANNTAPADLLSFRATYPGLVPGGDSTTHHIHPAWSKPSGISRRSSLEGGGRAGGVAAVQGELSLCICGLEIPSDIIQRNMNGTAATGGPDEDQRVSPTFVICTQRTV